MLSLSHTLVAVMLLLATKEVAAKPPSKSSLKVGMVFLAKEGTEYLDTGGIDLLGMISPEYLKLVGAPKDIQAQAIKMDIKYISEKAPESMPLTGNAKIVMDTSFAKAVDLDLLIIPGPPLHHQQTATEKAFILKYVKTPNTVVMSVCTGITPLAQSGALHAQNATGPLLLLPMLRSMHPAVKWTQKRWIGEGSQLWTSGGITNGMDMIAAWMRDYFWDRKEVVEFVLGLAAVGDRGLEYSTEEMSYWSKVKLEDHDSMHGGGMEGMEAMHGGMKQSVPLDPPGKPQGKDSPTTSGMGGYSQGMGHTPTMSHTPGMGMSGMGHIPGMNHGAKPVRSSSNLAGGTPVPVSQKGTSDLPESPPTPPSLSGGGSMGGMSHGGSMGGLSHGGSMRGKSPGGSIGGMSHGGSAGGMSHGGSMGGLSHLAGMLGAMSHGDSAGGMSHGSSGMSGHGMRRVVKRTMRSK